MIIIYALHRYEGLYMRPDVKKTIEVDGIAITSWQESFNTLILSFLNLKIHEIINEVELFRYARHVGSSSDSHNQSDSKINDNNPVKYQSSYIAECIGEQVSIITHPHAYILQSIPTPIPSIAKGMLPSNNVSPVWLQRTWNRLALPLLNELTNSKNSKKIIDNSNTDDNRNSNNNSQKEEAQSPCLLAVCALANTLSATILLPHSAVLAKVQSHICILPFVYETLVLL